LPASSANNKSSLANQIDRNPFLPSAQQRKPQTYNNSGQISQSSSSSSISSSSNEENDPGKELIRIEKKQIK